MTSTSILHGLPPSIGDDSCASAPPRLALDPQHAEYPEREARLQRLVAGADLEDQAMARYSALFQVDPVP